MSRFDRRLKGTGKKPLGSTGSITSSGSGASCVPQPIPTQGPLLSGMMFGGSTQRMTKPRRINHPSINKSLDSLVSEVNESSSVTNISDNNIEMINRRLQRLESRNNITSKTNKVYESLDKRLSALEKMYADNMENMEKYVRNQEDRINLLTTDYRKTLETLNKIIKDVNTKIIDLDENCLKKSSKEEKLEEVEIKELPKAKLVAVKKAQIIKEETSEKVIAEVTEEILSTVLNEKPSEKVKKNISLTVTEKE